MPWRSASSLAGLVEDGVRVGADSHHQVRGGNFHLRRQGPHVHIVHVDDTGDRGELAL